MGSSRVLRLGVGFKPRTPPPSRPPRSPSSLNRLSEAKRAKPGKPGVFPPTGELPHARPGEIWKSEKHSEPYWG